MRISDWSSDVCSSDLMAPVLRIFPALVFPEGDYLMEPYEILAGPLTIWLSPVGTAFPLIDAEPGAEWKLMGTRGTRNMSNDGVTVQLNQTVKDRKSTRLNSSH